MSSPLAEPTVVGLGELLWDCFADSKRPGGAPANVAFHAGQLGCRGIICSRVGSDELGNELCRHLAVEGLELDYIQRDPRRPTGTVTVDTSQPGHPMFVIHENVAWDALEFDANTKELMNGAAAVCFGTLAQRCEASRETIHECLESTPADCLIVYDVNLRQKWYARDWIERSLERADVVKLNHDESAVLTELLKFPAGSSEAFAASLRERYRVRVVCITRAGEGCLVLEDGETIDLPGVPVEVVDSVGAGDAFTAALISTLLDGWPLGAAAAFANSVGALVAGSAGAMPSLRAEFSRLRDEQAPRA